MRKFVLLDNSLAPAGGHHYEFAEAILTQAEKAGFRPLIGANIELPASAEFSHRWPTYRVFKPTIYHDYNLFYLARWEDREAKKKAVRWPGPLRPVSEWYNDLRVRLRRKRWSIKRGHRCQEFLDGCHALFKNIPLADGDVVMLPTVSDVELEALGVYFRKNPHTARDQWHLYFHNNFLLGRPPEHESQSFRLATMQKSLQSCLSGGRGYDLHFYCTTDKLAEQFERLDLGPEFRPLTFPVRDVLRRQVPSRTNGPKHVVCAGGFRDERGQFTLPQMAQAVWDDLLKPARIQIVVQRDKPDWQVPLPEDASRCAAPHQPIIYHPHPLSTDAYNDMMRSADVGLLLHDPHSYFARLSAVLQEYVCSGIPVIAPAGCWLGDQLAEENFQYAEAVLNDRRAHVVSHAPASWKMSGELLSNQSGGKWSCAGPQSPLTAEMTVPAGATQLVAQCDWLAPSASGHYLRLRVEQLHGDRNPTRIAESALARRTANQPLIALFNLPQHTANIRLILENAFGDSEITISQPDLTFLAAPETARCGLPTGASGLTFSHRSEIPRLLRELLDHYDHYRARAQEKSRHWCDRLSSQATWTDLQIDKPAASAKKLRPKAA